MPQKSSSSSSKNSCQNHLQNPKIALKTIYSLGFISKHEGRLFRTDRSRSDCSFTMPRVLFPEG